MGATRLRAGRRPPLPAREVAARRTIARNGARRESWALVGQRRLGGPRQERSAGNWSIRPLTSYYRACCRRRRVGDGSPCKHDGSLKPCRPSRPPAAPAYVTSRTKSLPERLRSGSACRIGSPWSTPIPPRSRTSARISLRLLRPPRLVGPPRAVPRHRNRHRPRRPRAGVVVTRAPQATLCLFRAGADRMVERGGVMGELTTLGGVTVSPEPGPLLA